MSTRDQVISDLSAVQGSLKSVADELDVMLRTTAAAVHNASILPNVLSPQSGKSFPQLENEIAKVMSRNARLQKTTADQQKQIEALVRKRNRLQRERDAFRQGDFEIALYEKERSVLRRYLDLMGQEDGYATAEIEMIDRLVRVEQKLRDLDGN